MPRRFCQGIQPIFNFTWRNFVFLVNNKTICIEQNIVFLYVFIYIRQPQEHLVLVVWWLRAWEGLKAEGGNISKNNFYTRGRKCKNHLNHWHNFIEYITFLLVVYSMKEILEMKEVKALVVLHIFAFPLSFRGKHSSSYLIPWYISPESTLKGIIKHNNRV